MVSQKLKPFQILVGPNASGKTTFLDVVTFISDIINYGPDETIINRSRTYKDLTWSGNGLDIEFAVECALPLEIIKLLGDNKDKTHIRYELKIGLSEYNEHIIKGERLILLKNVDFEPVYQRTLFPDYSNPEYSILNKKVPASYYKPVINKKPAGNDNFYPEIYKRSSGGWLPSFKLGYKKSSLGNLPADESKFPAATWLKDFFNNKIQHLVLNSQKIREASRPGQGKMFIPDGSNLPWVIEEMQIKYESEYKEWIKHVQMALPDVQDIKINEFQDTKYKYLKIIYNNGIEVPSWTASDGTLRLLALTIIAYLPGFKGVYLIEEPENGVHPKIIESVFQSLSSVYDAQILVATHSPVIIGIASVDQILCFAKTSDGITDIVSGEQHPMLTDWQGITNLSDLFASGVLG